MNRNYDEIIADMLMQIDKHSVELTRQSQQAEESHKLLVRELKDLRHNSPAADTELSAQLVHSATILDRIIKKNNLKL